MAAATLTLAIVLAIAGFTALVLVLFAWNSVKRWYLDAWPKGAVAFARVVSALITLGTRTGNNFDSTLNHAFLTAAIAWCLWEVSQIIGDYKMRQTARITQELERQVSFRTSLLTLMRRLVNAKRQRIEEELAQGNGRGPPIHRVRRALEPATQIYLDLEYMALFLRTLHREPSSEEALHQNFRVGLYVAEDGVMRPKVAHDFNNRSYDPFRSHRQAEDRFRLDNVANPAEVVRCVRDVRQLVILCDCERAADCNSFSFFREEQRNYLKSMIVYPIFSFKKPDGTIAEAAVVIDTDVAGHFKEEDRKVIQFFMDEFAARLNLETLLLGLLGQDSGDGHGSAAHNGGETQAG